ncbi:TetR/AcrR family transcriptional regulator [Xanthomonas hortorum]|uniref:TetR/AcrR family transcriptional regulator n=1 Tax=Xanthomonas hortorum TaxID=56454 RepID=UPI0015948544|nr:TetR/AcrR family transcriptional regulator [Xanthomonas hortorum]NHF65593.1 TetR/AcrR family transcriptional regulator [Xanthomonas hortorum]
MSKKDMRADGRQNRATLLHAAAVVFAREGFDAPLELVAAEAGVSRMTLYRNFPDRDALGYAIFEQNIVELRETAERLADEPEGFLVLLDILLKSLVESAGLTEALCTRSNELELVAQLRHRTIDLMMPLLHAAQESGVIRQQVDRLDLDVFMEMLGASLRGPAKTRKLRAERAMDILRRGLLLPRDTAAS